MNIFQKAARITAVAVLVSCISACSTSGYKSVEPWQGKVWRGVIVKTLIDTTTHRPTREMVEATHFDYKRDIGIRLARVHFSSGWNSVLVGVAVPDSIDFADIPKGTVVDVVTVIGPESDYRTARFTRIIRVVCKASDDACVAREKSVKRYGAVIEENPAHQDYGLTFDKRETKADVQKYD